MLWGLVSEAEGVISHSSSYRLPFFALAFDDAIKAALNKRLCFAGKTFRALSMLASEMLQRDFFVRANSCFSFSLLRVAVIT